MSSSVVVLALSVAGVLCLRIVNREEVSVVVEQFLCHEPQPRAFIVGDFVDDALDFENPFVVLHRCDRAGCCADADQRCAPETTEKVTLLVGYYEDDELLDLPIDVENHTSCVCRRDGSSIK